MITIDVRNFFDKPIKNNLKTLNNIRKIATSPGDNYTTACLLDYNYFNNCYKVIAIDLSKQQALAADLKVILQEIYLEKKIKIQLCYHYWRSKRNYFKFFTRNCDNVVNSFCVNIISV